jgi:hypothetical protein
VARIVRMWKAPAFLNPSETNSLEMVLVDSKVSYWVILFELCSFSCANWLGVCYCVLQYVELLIF